ncbi:MAG: winged helix-turn-helix transcriptional regulator [Hyphomicrobiales bacterium]|nr:winged helix-turn-helix transcriptional regulator [Hyphomicrobiales bacterium]
MNVQDRDIRSGNTEVLRLDDFLPYRLNVVTQAVSQGLADLYSAEFGLSVPEWRILAALGEQPDRNNPDWPGMTARDLARHGRMGKVMVSRASATLLERKIIARRANRDDRREHFLRLTPKGDGVYAAIVPRAREFQQLLEDGISPSDARAFDRVMQHLLDRAEAADATLLSD